MANRSLQRRSQVVTWSRLAHARIRAGVSQEALAKAVGVSAKTIGRLEANWTNANPSIRLLVNLSIALDVPPLKLCHPSWLAWNTLDDDAGEPPGEDFRKPGHLHIPVGLQERTGLPVETLLPPLP